MNTYTGHDGHKWPISERGNTKLSLDLYADLVAAIHIGRAYQARCERLEAIRDRLVEENIQLRGEIDRLELVS